MKKNKIEHYSDKEALDFHTNDKSGKIEIVSSKPVTTKRDLALAYSPGVAAPVKAISKNPDLAYDYTTKGNLVAVISNGSAILGMGNLGALASKPVMEGKAVLFKRIADIDLIKRILPHRYPFLLVDKVVDIDGFNEATGIKNITFNEPQFQGHFPTTPIMPGIMIVEAMAQTAAVMVGVGLNLADKNMLIYFMAIDNCKFRRKVTPGDQLIMNINTLREIGRAHV